MEPDIKETLARIEQLVAELHNIQKNAPVKKLIVKWLMAFYPVAVVVLLFVIDIDHRKFIEVMDDATELVSDINALMYPDESDK